MKDYDFENFPMCVLVNFRNDEKLQNLKSDKLYFFSNEEIVSISSCVKCELMILSINPTVGFSCLKCLWNLAFHCLYLLTFPKLFCRHPIWIYF